MSENTLNKLKNKGLECASVVLSRVNLANEEGTLRKCYMNLGKRLHGASKGHPLIDLKADSGFVEILGEIEERIRTIKSLKERLKKR